MTPPDRAGDAGRTAARGRDERWHLPAEVLHRYSDPARGALPAAQAASAEAHLDSCADCRSRLLPDPATGDLPAALGRAVIAQTDRAPQYRRASTWRRRFSADLPLAWLLAAVGVCVLAAVLDVAAHAAGSQRPSVLLLLAPVIPLLAVAAAWTPQLDPLHELTASTPAAGLGLLLRRTLVVLLAVVPLSALLGMLTAVAPPTRWLLPCLALTALTLALGARAGVHRAAAAVGVGWLALLVVPALVQQQVPALLAAPAAPGWLAVLVLAASAAWLGRHGYQRAAPAG